MEKVDLVVIGAGWYGLAAAKTYLELNPSAVVRVFDSGATLGGVWSKERLYPGLKSNNMLGTYEFSDYPMDTKTYGVLPGEHIPGSVVHRYLTNYAEHFGIFHRIQFQSIVKVAEHQETGGWVLKVTQTSQDSHKELFTNKLIVATGLTSEPAQPDIDGMASFEAPLFHSRDFLKNKETLSTAKRVCVLGGTKSAWDVVYAYASAGNKVDWVIRESGHGPTWMSPPYVTPLKKWLEKLTQTRLLTWFSPCIWGDADGYTSVRKILHGTAVGRFIVNTFWSVLENDVVTLNKFKSHPEVAKLRPWCSPMFIASGLSILNYDTNIFDLVRDGTIKVHIADIQSLGPRQVYLSNNEGLSVDALIACTGWKHSPPLKFLPEQLNLGLPRPLKTVEADTHVQLLQADNEILGLFPRLKDQPTPNPKAKPPPTTETEEHLTSFNLYRFMIPTSTTSTRDIAFMGALSPISITLVAQAQAVWISAYFGRDSLLSSTFANTPKMEKETLLHNRFGKWRYPAGFGARFPDFVFDTIPYVDLLLGDLGLKVWRKNGRVAEWLEPYGPEDYKGLVDEFVKTRQELEDSELKKTV